jgi:hypothetical protein
MKKGMPLNPNCSTIVCSLPTVMSLKKAKAMLKDIEDSNMTKSAKDGLKEVIAEWSFNDRFEIGTDMYPNEAIDIFLSKAKELAKGAKTIKDFPQLGCVDNAGGGGNWDYVEASWEVAQLYALKKFENEEKAKDFDKLLWEEGNDPVLVDECKICIDDNKLRTECRDYVKRVVGECKGINRKTPFDTLAEMMKEAESNVVKPKL